MKLKEREAAIIGASLFMALALAIGTWKRKL